MIIFNKLEKLLIYKHRRQVIKDAIANGEKDCHLGQYEINEIRDKINKLDGK